MLLDKYFWLGVSTMIFISTMMTALYVPTMSWLSQQTTETRSFFQANYLIYLVILIITHSWYYFVCENRQYKDFHFVYICYRALNLDLWALAKKVQVWQRLSKIVKWLCQDYNRDLTSFTIVFLKFKTLESMILNRGCINLYVNL